MEIIKQGKTKEELKAILNKTKCFECMTCGCIFKANEGEYEASHDYIYTTYYCNCPNCGIRAFEARTK